MYNVKYTYKRMIYFIEALILSFLGIKSKIWFASSWIKLYLSAIILCHLLMKIAKLKNPKLKFLFVSHKNISGWLSTLLSSPRIGYTSFIPDFYELFGFVSFCQFWEYFSFSSSFLRYCPVYDFLTERISSGLPSKRRDPPLSPPSGPRSTM